MTEAEVVERLRAEDDGDLADLIGRLADGEGRDAERKLPLALAEGVHRWSAWLVSGESADSPTDVLWAYARKAMWGDLLPEECRR